MEFEKIKSITKIGIENTSDLIVEKNHNFIANDILVHNSGYGKGLISEGLVEWYHKHGYLIMVIADPKHEVEYGYQMFVPREKYHLDHLNMISNYVGKWKLPGKHKVKLYHPFTFNLPTNRLLPETNIFTIPFKSLGRAEWGLLSEVHGENETVSVLLKASEEISNEDGIYSFAHYIQDSVKGKVSGKKKKADWRNFGLEATSGTMKELSKVSNILRPFKKHFFLSKQNSEYNLDWKKILTDQESYHIFTSHFIGRREEKVTDFLVLYLLENVLKNKQFLKKPVLIVIPEISYLCPYRPVGHKEFLANSIKKNLKTIRSEGRGISTVADSQVWGDVDEDLRGASTINLFGELGDIKDIENVCKALGWKKGVKDQLNKSEISRTYLIRGVEEGSIDDSGYLFFYPRAMHCEPTYNFEEMYREHNRDNPEEYPLKSYKTVSEDMKRELREEENKLKKKIKKKEADAKKLEEKKNEERDANKLESESEEVVKEKIKEKEDKTKEEIMKLCYEAYQELNSYRKVSDKFKGMNVKSHKTAKKYIDAYAKKLEENNDIDYEDKVIDELSVD